MALDLITTTAGRNAIIAAITNGTSIQVKDVRLSDTDQAVSTATTALTSVVATLTDVVGSVRAAGAGNAMHLVIKDDSAAAYTVRALSVRLLDNTVLMVYSQAAAIATKAAGSSLHLAIDLSIDADLAATITFGDTDYALPAASESSPGLIEIATSAEVVTGSDAVRAVTPAGLTAGVAAKLLQLSSPAAVAYAVTQTQTFSIPLPPVYYLAAGVAWIGSGGSPARISAMNSAPLWIQLDPWLPEGCLPANITLRVRPGAARTGANRMIANLWSMSRNAASVTGIGAAVFDDGTSNAQDLVLPSTGVISKSDTTYWLSVTSGNTGASSPDTVYNLFATPLISNPLKR